MSFHALISGLLLALLYSLAISGAVYGVIVRRATLRAADAVALGIGAAPFLAGLVTIAAIALLGNRSDGSYLGLHFAFASTLALLAAGSLRHVGIELWERTRSGLRSAQPLWDKALSIEAVLTTVLVVQFAWLAYVVFVVPLIGNDPLEYAIVARVLYGRRTLDAYPLTEPDPVTGMFAPWTHPPLYVALIFLGYVLQGGSDSPGLMRLIPLYCIGAVLLMMYRVAVWLLPGELGRRAGLLTSILILATPLVPSMVGEASIDTLPVLGLTLVFAVACFVTESPPRARAMLTGVALGLSLWAHSSALLFPILAVAGIAAIRRLQSKPYLAECAGTLIVGGALGSLPYLRNLAIFGSPISDNPAVFALPKLDWHSYFTVARGMPGTADAVVVGVLRGWTAWSEFGVTFWLMMLGAVWLVRDRLRQRIPDSTFAGSAGALTIVLVFHAGMLFSVLLGSSLMVKNARYLLSVVPFAALVASIPLSRIVGLHDTALIRVRRTASEIAVVLRVDRLRGPIALAMVTGIVWIAIQQVDAGMAYWRYYLKSLHRSLAEPERKTLQKFPFYRVQDFMRRELPPEAVILSLRPADMYYAKHRMVSYLDPRLLRAYALTDPAKMAELLREIGVTHIYKPNYSLPVVYNSALMDLLADQRLAWLIHSDGQYAVYRLDPTPEGHAPRPARSRDIGPGRLPWTSYGEALIPLFSFLCRTGDVRVDPAIPLPTARPCRWMPSHRATYASGAGRLDDLDPKNYLEVQPGMAYRFEVDVGGRGMLRMGIYELRGPIVSSQQIDDIVLTGERRTLTGVFKVPDDVTRIRFALWVDGRGELSIHDVRIEALYRPGPVRAAIPTVNDAADPSRPAR